MISIPLTERQIEVFKWMEDALEDYWIDDMGAREDNGVYKYDNPAIPYIKDKYLIIDEKDKYHKAVITDIEYRLTEQIQDMAYPTNGHIEHAGKGFARAADNLWKKIAIYTSHISN